MKCGRCQKALVEGEFCWWCLARLCGDCWEEIGHCGHPEADAHVEAARRRALEAK